ncbi:hypothetical protein Peur_024228 [Populus x canadensis]
MQGRRWRAEMAGALRFLVWLQREGRVCGCCGLGEEAESGPSLGKEDERLCGEESFQPGGCWRRWGEAAGSEM